MKKLSIDTLLIKLGLVLLFGYPFIYIVIKLTKNSNFILIKEVIVGLILIFITLDVISKRKIPKVFLIYLLIGISSMVVALHSLDDYVFFFIYYREFLVYPLASIYLGVIYRSSDRDLLKDVYYSLGMCILLVLFYSIVFPQDSYGVTGRLTSFFAGEHIPAVVGLLYILFYFSMRRSSELFRLDAPTIIAVVSLYIIFLTDSRFALVSLLVLLLLQLLVRKGKDRAILLLFIIILLITSYLFINFSHAHLSVRGYDYNLNARIEQYDLARLLIEEHWFLGVGVDKYGKLGPLEKEFIFNSHSTITMDSTIIKYAVNTGIPLVIIWLIFLFSPIFKRKLKNNYITTVYFTVLIVSVATGLVTGKLGAFPLNFYLFLILGFSYSKSLTGSNDVKSV